MIKANKKAPRPGDAFQTAPTTSSDFITFPSPTTVKAAVLADLLEDQEFTHKECWLRHGSSRLSHHIHVLIREHGWQIACNERAIETSDGRRQAIGFYRLRCQQVDSSIARAYIADVRKARAALRAGGAK